VLGHRKDFFQKNSKKSNYAECADPSSGRSLAGRGLYFLCCLGRGPLRNSTRPLKRPWQSRHPGPRLYLTVKRGFEYVKRKFQVFFFKNKKKVKLTQRGRRDSCGGQVVHFGAAGLVRLEQPFAVAAAGPLEPLVSFFASRVGCHRTRRQRDVWTVSFFS
jgi:hypothetical protein